MWLNEGPVALIVVSFLWGTYTPLLRFLYDIPGIPTRIIIIISISIIISSSCSSSVTLSCTRPYHRHTLMISLLIPTHRRAVLSQQGPRPPRC